MTRPPSKTTILPISFKGILRKFLLFCERALRQQPGAQAYVADLRHRLIQVMPLADEPIYNIIMAEGFGRQDFVMPEILLTDMDESLMDYINNNEKMIQLLLVMRYIRIVMGSAEQVMEARIIRIFNEIPECEYRFVKCPIEFRCIVEFNPIRGRDFSIILLSIPEAHRRIRYAFQSSQPEVRHAIAGPSTAENGNRSDIAITTHSQLELEVAHTLSMMFQKAKTPLQIEQSDSNSQPIKIQGGKSKGSDKKSDEIFRPEFGTTSIKELVEKIRIVKNKKAEISSKHLVKHKMTETDLNLQTRHRNINTDTESSTAQLKLTVKETIRANILSKKAAKVRDTEENPVAGPSHSGPERDDRPSTSNMRNSSVKSNDEKLKREEEKHKRKQEKMKWKQEKKQCEDSHKIKEKTKTYTRSKLVKDTKELKSAKDILRTALLSKQSEENEDENPPRKHRHLVQWIYRSYGRYGHRSMKSKKKTKKKKPE